MWSIYALVRWMILILLFLLSVDADALRLILHTSSGKILWLIGIARRADLYLIHGIVDLWPVGLLTCSWYWVLFIHSTAVIKNINAAHAIKNNLIMHFDEVILLFASFLFTIWEVCTWFRFFWFPVFSGTSYSNTAEIVSFNSLEHTRDVIFDLSHYS